MEKRKFIVVGCPIGEEKPLELTITAVSEEEARKKATTSYRMAKILTVAEKKEHKKNQKDLNSSELLHRWIKPRRKGRVVRFHS